MKFPDMSGDYVADAKALILHVENIVGSKFYGLENVTDKGVRRWSLGPRPPKRALAVIDANRIERDILAKPERKPRPEHLLTRWDAQKHSWRTVDLRTVRKIWFRDPATKNRITVDLIGHNVTEG